jgi:hypothetical protein
VVFLVDAPENEENIKMFWGRTTPPCLLYQQNNYVLRRWNRAKNGASEVPEWDIIFFAVLIANGFCKSFKIKILD